MNKLRVGVIGLGMGRHHVKQFQECAGAQVIAIADTDEQRLGEVGHAHGVEHRYTDGMAMIESEELDIVVVATPNKFHHPLTLAALQAGRHVFCEKPMALHAKEGEEMVAAAKAAGKRLMINFSFRFSPQAWVLKKEIDRGLLGDIYFGRSIWLRRCGMPRFGGWFGQKELSGGGPLIDLGVHRLDLALWWMGYPEPEWVLASTYNHLASRKAKEENKRFDVEDFAAAMIRFRNGATLELEASWAGHIKEAELMETRVLGTEGGALHKNIDGGYKFQAEIFYTRDGCHYDLQPQEPIPGHQSAIPHFVDAIHNDKPHVADGEEGLIVARLLDGIYTSAARGEPIHV